MSGGVLEGLAAVLAVVLLAVFVAWVYHRRELAVRGRGVLAALRIAALALLVVLLWNPSLPAPGSTSADDAVWVALDASRSMTAPLSEAGDSTAWSRALERLASGDGRVLTLADPPAPLETPDSALPRARETRLAPLLRRAAEAGVREVRLASDLRIDDPVAVAAALARAPFRLVVHDVGGPVLSAGIAELTAPSSARAGSTVEVAVEAFATEAAAGDSALLRLERDGAEVASWRLALPPSGTTARRVAEVELPERTGPVVWRASVVVAGDVFGDDDRRAAVTAVDPSEGILALVSLTPDWEPRFLFPVLEEVSGLPTRGWLRVGPDRFLPMDGGASVPADSLTAALDDARLLVLHGLDGDAAAWAVGAAGRARRLLVLPADAEGAADVGVETVRGPAGEWYATAPVPASPLAGALAGLEPAGMPPLSRPLVPVEGQSGLEPLLLQRPGAGATTPGLLMLDRGERRAVVTLATGWWRWAFRPGPARDAYRQLWSGVAGWLLELEEGAVLAGVAPEDPVVPAGEPVAWRAPEASGGALEVELSRGDAPVRTDTLSVSADGEAAAEALEAGSYRWVARVVAPDTVAARGRVWTGVLEAETWSADLRPPRMDPEALAARVGAEVGNAPAPRGEPLRTRIWPWILLLALLSAEWIGRRRIGLR